MSKSQKIYFDNAATSYPKPQSVLNNIVEYLNNAGNPGRGAHHYALYGARAIMEARQVVARYLGVEQEERLIFTPGCTHSLNFVIKGLMLKDFFKSGDKVVISGLEHNSVTRPLEQVKNKIGISIEALELAVEPQQFLENLEASVNRNDVKLCVLTAASNVTGQVLPVREASKICKKYGVQVLVDAAQVAGKLPAELSETDITYWCTSGHKGLLGPPGVGLLYIAPGYDLEPVIQGGTGSISEDFATPNVLPDRFEAGTLPGANIAGLRAGVEYLISGEPEKKVESSLLLLERFMEWSKGNQHVRVFGPGPILEPERAMPVVSVAVDGVSPGELANILGTEYGIAVRPGLHCAAQAHKSLGTIDTGLTRISFGPNNSEDELTIFLDALSSVINDKVGQKAGS